MEFIDRLKLFIKSKGLGQTKFEERVGFSRGYISKVKTSIGADKLSNIVEAFPDLTQLCPLKIFSSYFRVIYFCNCLIINSGIFQKCIIPNCSTQ
jgi:transcriptional regulator with XRE-family HTH domain